MAFSLRDLEARFKDRWPRVALTDVKTQGATGSGRVRDLVFTFADGSQQTLAAHEFRMRIGHDKIKSTLFDLKREGGRVVLVGRGNGHGVGLCQWGARALAEQGKNFDQILSRYYARAKLVRPTFGMQMTNPGTM